MNRACRLAVVLLVSLSVAVWNVGKAAAFADESETKQMMEKSLSAYEIEREIRRITERQYELANRIQRLAAEIARQEQAVADKREKAGRVLRAYYQGERNLFWNAVLALDNLSEWLSAYEWIRQIIDNDRKTLAQFTESYRELRNRYDELVAADRELQQKKQRLTAQQARLAELRAQILQALEQNPSPASAQHSIQALTALWQNEGLPALNMYFRALENAMLDFPEFLAANRQNMTFRGTTCTVTVWEQELNEFLRSKNDLFDRVEFRFEPGQLAALAKHGGIEVKIAGHYTLEQEPEPSFRFRLDEIRFNGIPLPDSTLLDMEEQYDLRFYPKKLAPFFHPEKIWIEDRSLTAELKFDWNANR
jgi:hypothetical protein